MVTPARPANAGQMSSRLATMKFMQRAAASSPVSGSEQVTSQSNKRRRTGDRSHVSDPKHDFLAIQEALAAEELKRTQALERQAVEAGETRWTLDVTTSTAKTDRFGLSIVNAGYGAIDAASSSARIETHNTHTQLNSGRKSFGNFGKAAENLHSRIESDANEHFDSSNESGEESNSSADQIVRVSTDQARGEVIKKQKVRHKAQQFEAAESAERRRSKSVKLNTLNSISSGGGLKFNGPSSEARTTCDACGKQGHRKRDCPNTRGFKASRY